jgi:hypothetical protein
MTMMITDNTDDMADDKADDTAHDHANDNADNTLHDNADDRADDKANGTAHDRADDTLHDNADDMADDKAGCRRTCRPATLAAQKLERPPNEAWTTGLAVETRSDNTSSVLGMMESTSKSESAAGPQLTQ